MIISLFNPSIISEYIQHGNKAVFSLVLVILGFAVGLPWFSNYSMHLKVFLIMVLSFLLLVIVVAGTTRQKVIKNWHDLKYHWFISLLDDAEFIKENNEWKVRGQENDNFKNISIFLGHIKNSLNITIEKSFCNISKSTLDGINQYRAIIKADITNRNLFYYLFRPKKTFLGI